MARAQVQQRHPILHDGNSGMVFPSDPAYCPTKWYTHQVPNLGQDAFHHRVANRDLVKLGPTSLHNKDQSLRSKLYHKSVGVTQQVMDIQANLAKQTLPYFQQIMVIWVGVAKVQYQSLD
jgi:hypothetical protein